MRHSTQLRATILQKAGELFMHHGYGVTSIKQIAHAAGCTTAALYYYYEGGKSHILKEVIQNFSLLENLRAAVSGSATLEELLERIGHVYVHLAPEVLRRMNWLMLEYPNLSPDEQQMVQQQITLEQQLLIDHIAQYMPDRARARTMALVVFCTYLGYGQVSASTEVVPPQPPAHFIAEASSILVRGSGSSVG
jgi:AcrR family transcriptional regulator